MKRLFVGAFPPLEAAREVHRAAKAALDPAEVRLVPAEEIHMTLHFLGATQAGRIPDLASALARRLRPIPAPRLSISGTGAFPDAASTRVLWVGARGPLDSLAAAARAAVREAGLQADDEPWRAHLTVARPKGGRVRASPAFLGLELDLPWLLDEVLLLESCPGASGPGRFPVQAAIRLAPESV